MAAWVSRQLGAACRTIVRPPFVLAGDAEQRELDACYREHVLPTVRAMAVEYSDRVVPQQPVTLLLFNDPHRYRQCARELFGEERVSSYGCYWPHLRIVLANLSRGPSGLRHELTHALVAFDFPGAPDWLGEGLASLHEDGRIRADGSGIEGLVNRRVLTVRDAIRSGGLRPLRRLAEDGGFRGEGEALCYAHARYFCLYMQQRGVLAEFYRRFRDHAGEDPSGTGAVAAVFPGCSWEQIDLYFRLWVMDLPGVEDP